MRKTLPQEQVRELTEVLRKPDSFTSLTLLSFTIWVLTSCEQHMEFVERWSNDRSIYYEEYHLNGKLHGLQKLYDSKLLLFQSYTYENGVLQGPSVDYSITGDTLGFCNFVNGEIEGKYIHYNTKRKIIEENLFTKGKLNGISIRYFDNGMVKDSGAYDMGVKRGLWCSYDSLNLNRFCEVKTGIFP